MGTNQKHKIAILTDTGSYIYPKEAEELGIYLLPLQIVEDNKSYLDLFEIDTIDIYEKIYKGKALKTSLPSPYTIEKTINKIKEDGYDYILLIPLTTGISSTANTVKMIAVSLNMTLKIIDTYTTCGIQKHMVLRIKRLIELGIGVEEIEEIVKKEINNSSSYILAADLHHLKRGGRLTPLAASLANMLKIVPILHMNQSTEGKIDVYDKVRTKKRAKERLVIETLKHIKHKNYKFYVLHSDNEKEAMELKEMLIQKKIEEKNIEICSFSSVVSVHVGMKCLAIQHIEETKI